MSSAPETKVPIRLSILGQAQVAAGFGQVRAAAAGLNSMLGTVGLSVTGLLGAAGLGALVKASIDTADGFAKLSQKVGDSTEHLSGLAYGADLSDVSLEELTVSLQKLGLWMSKTGQGTKDLSSVLNEQADIFARMPDGPAKTARAVELFGKSGVKMIPLLNGGAEGLREMADEAERFGLIVSGQTALEAEAFNDNLTRLEKRAKGLAMALTKELLPSLNSVAKTLLAFNASANGGNGEGILGAVASPFLDYFRAIAERSAVQLNAGLAVAKSLWAGEGIKGALTAGITEGTRALMRFRGEVEKLDAVTGGGDKKKEGYAAALDFNARRIVQSMEANRTRIASIEGDSSLSSRERRNELLAIYAEQLQNVAALQDDLEANKPADAVLFTDTDGVLRGTEAYLKFQKESNDLTRQRVDLLNQQDRLGPDPDSFRDQFRLALGDMQDAWGSWAEQSAAAFKSVFGTVVGSLTDGITGLITRTMTWGEALRNIGSSILTGIVRAIIGMGVQWVVTQLMMATVGKLIQAAGLKATAVIAAGYSAAWATPATLATIATYGAAAGAAPGLIIGAEAITMGSAVASSATGFRGGGYTGDGPPSEVAGPAHRGEFYFSAPQVDRIGLPALEAMASGAPASASGASQPESGPGQNVTIATFDSRQDARRWAKSKEAEVWFYDMANRHAGRMSRA